MWDWAVEMIHSDIGIVFSFLISFVGFLITIWVLCETRNIKNNFLRRARLPENIKELEKNNKFFLQCLYNWKEKHREGIVHMKVIKEIIDNIQPKLPKDKKGKCKNIIKDIIKVNESDENSGWEAYQNLCGFLELLKQLQKDTKWD